VGDTAMFPACEKLISPCCFFSSYGLESGMVGRASHALHERGGPPQAFSKPNGTHVYK